ncbi:uncharacterized protein G6M90_00g069420 [Metarhizium brunneum]|uniref:Uncharacterized protein n=1 Tax=Metarhizium brunneum TaxID=500148 RepID=A0A7D5UYL6_9HYPO|nr:hypothetical protein G6M90_00g069420 [Metarhizium brunneum]
MSKRQHARAHTRCGACGLLFHEDDLIHSFVRRGSVVTGHGPSKFSVDRYGISCDDVQFCANLDCREHHKEASIVHADCLKIFCRGDTPWGLGDNLRWLWVASTWRSPWRGALPLNAPPRINLDRRLDDLRLTKRMTTLPPELYAMIRDFSLSTNPMPNFALHHYNQLVAAFDLFREDVREEFLDRIESWTRGELPEVCEEGNKPFIRLSIDWQGLQSIEKMAVLPPAANLRSDCTGYVVEKAGRLSNVIVKFQVMSVLSSVGHGDPSEAWPQQSQWVDFESIWSANLANVISESCEAFGQTNNSEDESADLKSAIQSVANSSGVDDCSK